MGDVLKHALDRLDAATVECVVYEAQTGIVRERPASFTSYYEWHIPATPVNIRLLSLMSVPPKHEDIMWLQQNEVPRTRAKYKKVTS